MHGRALLLLIATLACSSKGGADAASGSGGSAVDAAGGSGGGAVDAAGGAGGDGAGAGGASGRGGAGGGARAGTTGGGGQGGSAGGGDGDEGAGGGFCASQGMACSNGATLCCVPLVCAGSCVQPPSNQDAIVVDAACSGSAGFGCIFNSCNNDVGTAAICSNGTWACPGGAIDSGPATAARATHRRATSAAATAGCGSTPAAPDDGRRRERGRYFASFMRAPPSVFSQ